MALMEIPIRRDHMGDHAYTMFVGSGEGSGRVKPLKPREGETCETHHVKNGSIIFFLGLRNSEIQIVW